MPATVTRRFSSLRALRALLVLPAIGLLVGGWALFLQLSGNIHEVVPGELYRSAQLSPERLERVLVDEGIRSVINLKGGGPGKAWWDAQTAVLDRIGVAHTTFSWKAKRIVTDAEVESFLAAATALPKPILVHCHAGADRSGLASALYVALVKRMDDDAARAQLSFRYGHVALPMSMAWPMDVTLERELADRAAVFETAAADPVAPALLLARIER